MKKYINIFLPKPVALTSLTAIPLVFTVYFLVTQYSNKFIAEQSVDYFDIQNELVRKILFDNRLAVGFTRASDFIFWGVIAAAAIVISWFVGVVKTTTSNHKAVEGFNNFQSSEGSWHRTYIVKIVIKTLLAVISLYLLIATISKYIPNISTEIGVQLRSPSTENIITVVRANLIVYLCLVLTASVIKMFRHIQVE